MAAETVLPSAVGHGHVWLQVLLRKSEGGFERELLLLRCEIEHLGDDRIVCDAVNDDNLPQISEAVVRNNVDVC